MSKKEKNIDMKLLKAAKKCQQNFYELLSDWNTYDSKKPHFLKNFIGIVLFGPPKIKKLNANSSFLLKKQMDNEIFFHNEYEKTKINKIYEKIVQHGMQNTTKQEIMCGLIYNVTFDKTIECGKYFTDEHITKSLQPIPIFKVLKNIKKSQIGNNITTKFAVYYIDDCERVYKNWTDYLNNNVLPECFMVVPKAGEYQGDCNNQWSEKMSHVSVEIYDSPASKEKTMNTIDRINKFVTLGCAVAATLNPVGATVTALGAVGMGLSGMWLMGRNSQKIADRHLHEQSIGIENRDGFVRWFGLASSILAVASSGGSLLLSGAIKNGSSLSTVVKLAHDSVQMGVIAVEGVKAGLMINNLYESQDNKNVSAQDVLNLVSNLLLFTNSTIDIQFAKNILTSNHTDLIQDFEHSLRSCRHRKEFCRLVKNSTSLSSNTPEQIIRSTFRISNKELLSSCIDRNDGSFLLKGMKVLASNGSILIDGKCLMTPMEFIEKFKANRIKPVVIGLTTNCSVSNNIFDKVLKNFLNQYEKELKNSQLSVSQFSSFLNNVGEVDKPDIIFSKLLSIGIKLLRKIDIKYDFANNFLSEIVNFLWQFIQMNLREKIGPCRQSDDYREFIMKIIFGVYSSMKRNMDEWIDALKFYLLINFKNLQQKIKNSKEGNLYLLQVM